MHEQRIKLFELNDLRMQKAFNKTMDKNQNFDNFSVPTIAYYRKDF